MLRFLLYNIRYGAGIGKRFHLPVPYIGYLKRTNGKLAQILEFIKFVQPDIIGLLEVDSGSFRSNNSNQAESIAKEIKHLHVFHNKYDSKSFVQKVPVMNKQGNALLTNQEIIEKRFHYFNEGVKRLIIEIEFNNFDLFLVHLSIKYRHRQSQLRQLYTIVNQVKKPIIIAGDFNVFWGAQELQLFLAATGLKSVNHNGQPSHPSRSPRRQLDYILHSPEISAYNFQLPHIKLSDHMPLICDFELT